VIDVLFWTVATVTALYTIANIVLIIYMLTKGRKK
jgi:hypothetical protein